PARHSPTSPNFSSLILWRHENEHFPERGVLSVLPRIEFTFAGHSDGKRPERVNNLDRPCVLCEHVWQTPVSHRTFVQVRPNERDAARRKPTVHFFPREAALCFFAAKEPARAVDRRIKRLLGLIAFDAFDNNRVVSH